MNELIVYHHVTCLTVVLNGTAPNKSCSENGTCPNRSVTGGGSGLVSELLSLDSIPVVVIS